MNGVKGVGEPPEHPTEGCGPREGGAGGRPGQQHAGEAQSDAGELVQPIDVQPPPGRKSRHGEEQRQEQAAPFKTAAAPQAPGCRTVETRHEHARGEGKEEPQQSSRHVCAGEGPAHADHAVAGGIAEGVPAEPRPQQSNQQRETPRRQTKQQQPVDDVGYILEKERPGRAVEREDLAVAPHVKARARPGRDKEAGAEKGHGHHRPRCRRALRCHGVLNAETQQTKAGGDDHHGMQSHEAPQKKGPGAHAAPQAIVVGVAHHEA